MSLSGWHADTSLDGGLLLKLHSIHLLLLRVLDPYHKLKLRLLSISKVQELAREMEGFAGLVTGNGSGGHSKPTPTLSTSLLQLTGDFIRQGILLKLNKRKGLQNRIFFLVSQCHTHVARCLCGC